VDGELRVELENALLQLQEAHELAQLGSWSWDIARDEIVWSAEMSRIFGEEPTGGTRDFDCFLARIHPEDRPLVVQARRRRLATDVAVATQYRVVRPGGEVRWVNGRGRVVRDELGHPVRMVGVCQDVTEQRLSEERLKQQAMHDPVTGLPNRLRFLEQLDQALLRRQLVGGTVAVLFIDLDRFKAINDGFGHPHGDRVLLAVANRLRSVVRAVDSLARFGGDEFAVLCEDLVGGGAEALGLELLDALDAPFDVDGITSSTGASVGIALADDDATADSLLREADIAMYQAKEAGGHRIAVFDHAARVRASADAGLADELRLAVEEGQLRVHYQPVMDVADGTVRGVEALVRWQHPERGLLSPGEFIDAAESSGVIVEIGAWVLRTACRHVVGLGATRLRPLRVAVNISARQLGHPGFIGSVAEILRTTGIDPGLVCLEITESVLMEDTQAAIESLTALKTLGVELAIDDFGTGFSSLSYLRRFPVDIVKVDRSFVGGLGLDASADAIVAAVVNLSHALRLRVVAEGVEQEAQLIALRALHCDEAQGFYWSRPRPPAELDQALADVPAAAVEHVDVDVFTVLAERTQALRAATGRPVVLQAPTRLGSVHGDPQVVKAVLDHLLGNAATYSPPDSPVVVSAEADRRWVRVSVTDYGIGMSAEECARCFEQFWQADPSNPRSNGTGVGLFMVRSLLETMGGHVGVKSARDKGAVFTFALPRSARAAQRPTGTGTRGVSQDSTIREFMRQIGVPTRSGT
jgi:diguanylate cyclase (GGDEF)-like protein